MLPQPLLFVVTGVFCSTVLYCTLLASDLGAAAPRPPLTRAAPPRRAAAGCHPPRRMGRGPQQRSRHPPQPRAPPPAAPPPALVLAGSSTTSDSETRPPHLPLPAHAFIIFSSTKNSLASHTCRATRCMRTHDHRAQHNRRNVVPCGRMVRGYNVLEGPVEVMNLFIIWSSWPHT